MPLIIHIETQSYHFDRETYVIMNLCLKYRPQEYMATPIHLYP